MLINLRNALMTGKRLPYDAEVEYLESTGTQWIDTGVAPNENTAVDTSIYWSTTAYNMNPFGVNESINGTVNRYMVQVSYSDTPVVYFGSSLDFAKGGAGRNNWNDIVLELGHYYNNGSLIGSVSYSPFQFTRTLGLFAYHTSNSFVNKFVGRVRYFRIRIGSTLVRDFIPVRKGTVGYLYDRVSGKLFGNAGTGDFVLGPDKN